MNMISDVANHDQVIISLTTNHKLKKAQPLLMAARYIGCQIENKCCDSCVNPVVTEQCSQLDFNCQCARGFSKRGGGSNGA